MLTSCDALRRPKRFVNFLTVMQTILPKEHSEKPDILKQALKIVMDVDTLPLQQKNIIGKEFAVALTELRLQALNAWLK